MTNSDFVKGIIELGEKYGIKTKKDVREGCLIFKVPVTDKSYIPIEVLNYCSGSDGEYKYEQHQLLTEIRKCFADTVSYVLQKPTVLEPQFGNIDIFNEYVNRIYSFLADLER